MEYLLKSVGCLLLLLLFYRLFLQQEVLYRFNRFFLLVAVVGSFFIPLITFEVVKEVPVELSSEVVFPSENFAYESSASPASTPIVPSISVPKTEIPWVNIGWGVYLLGVAVFLVRFLRNIRLIRDQIRQNVQVSYRGETLILMNAPTSPFSFLRYIFYPKSIFEKEGIPEAIFLHERCHVQEKHSWDILFVELLLIPFWFHPGLYFALQAIRLNHEFIADQEVIKKTPLQDYQYLLVSILSGENGFSLGSSLNFSLTKKRFEMMKRKTANSTKWILILGIIPVLGAMVYFFSEKVPASAEPAMTSEVPVIDSTARPNETHILIRTDGKIEVDGQVIEVGQLPGVIDSIYNQNTLARISADQGVEMGQLADVQGILRENDLRKVVYQEQSHFQSDALKTYIQLYGKYQTKSYENRLFSKWTQEEIRQLESEFQELRSLYSSLALKERQQVQRVNFPFFRLEKDGVSVYKKIEELTEEERKSMNC